MKKINYIIHFCFAVMLCIVCKATDVTGYAGAKATFLYSSETKTLTIKGTGAMFDCTDKAGERPSWYDYRNEIETVVVEDGITTIGTMSFLGCSSIKSLYIPSSLEKINGKVFDKTTALSNLYLESLASWCNVVLSSGSTSSPFNSSKNMNYIYEKTSNGDYQKVENLVIPSGVSVVKSSTFLNCTGLRTVNFGNANTIKTSSFSGCSNLNKVVFNGTPTIESSVFQNCSNLTNMTFNCEPGTMSSSSNPEPSQMSIFVSTDYLNSYLTNTFWNNYDIYHANDVGRVCRFKSANPGNASNVICPSENKWVCNTLALPDKVPFAATVDFSVANATYTRESSNTWGTICLPFPVSSNANVSYFTKATIDGDVLYLTAVKDVPAGIPAIYNIGTDKSLTCNATNVQISSEIEAENVQSDINLIGTFESVRVEDANAYYIKNNEFLQRSQLEGGYFTVAPYRAYFTMSQSASPYFDISVSDDGFTAVKNLVKDNAYIVGYYNLKGERFDTLQKGLNIVKYSDGSSQKVMIN